MLIGTTTGLYDDTGATIIEGTRINHIARSGDSTWVVDGKGRLHHDATVAAAVEAPALLCIQPTPESLFVGTSEARLFTLEADGLEEDEFFTDAPGREQWYTPWGGPPDVRSMAVDKSDTLYLNVHVGGILRYDDSGLVPTIDQGADVHQVIADPAREGLVIAATAYGLAISTNGHDYQTHDDGLFAPYCRAVALLGDTAFVSASNGPRATEGRLYRTSLDNVNLSQVAGPFDSNLDTHCLAVDAASVWLGHGNTVWRSDDEGDSWEVVRDDLPKVTCLG